MLHVRIGELNMVSSGIKYNGLLTAITVSSRTLPLCCDENIYFQRLESWQHASLVLEGKSILSENDSGYHRMEKTWGTGHVVVWSVWCVWW